MKKTKLAIVTLCGAMLLSSCGMSNTAKGGLIGGGGGAAAGALIGALIGNGKGAAIGAGIGAAVGAGAGVLIGNKMDKAKKAAEAIEGAEAQALKDAEGLTYVKVTFDSGILFTTGKSALTSTAKNSLSQFARSLLQHHNLKASILQCSASSMVQLSHPDMTTAKTIAFTV